MAKTHRLKSWPDFFGPLLAGSRTFDIRKNDKNFAVGDTVVILEFDDRAGKFTGRELRREIVSMLEGVGSGGIPPLHGLMRGYAVLEYGQL